jgi:hypothetical protein
LWRDRLLISLAPDSVGFARVAGGPRPRLLAKQVLDCDPAFGAEHWQGAVTALSAAIAPLRAERLQATIVLSSHFVRYAVVPFDPKIGNPDEKAEWARYHFTRIHGERARTWAIRLSEGPHGAARLASAVDTALIEALRACFPSSGRARLVSVQPYLMSAFNRWRGAISRSGAWLLLVEPQRTCLALLAAGAWATVRTVRGEFPGPGEWCHLLEHHQLQADIAAAPRTVLVHAPAEGKSVAGDARGWSFLGLALPPLDGFLPLEDGRLAMALSAR